MKHVSILILLFLTALFSACSDDEMGGNGKPREGILLTLTNGSLDNKQTKTTLESSANLHHIHNVYVCLYKMDDNGQDGTLALDPHKLEWDPMKDPGYGADAAQVKEFLLEHENLTSGNYTLLCIGLDNDNEATNLDQEKNAATAYDLPQALKQKKLSQAKATLAAGKTKDDIAHAELFAGWAAFEYQVGKLSEVEVEMRRRVAGVICYLKDIPYTITDNQGTRRVTHVIVRLCQPQNQSVGLKRVSPQVNEGQTVIPDDFGSNPFEAKPVDYSQPLSEESLQASEVLVSFDMSVWGAGQQEGKNLYATKINELLSADKYLPNTLYAGAFLLPFKYALNDQTPTLQVELWGKTVTSVDENPEPEAEETFIKKFPAVYEEAATDNQKNYSIRPNYVYHIGQKPTADDKHNDYPESLSGSKLKLDVKYWTYQQIETDFPTIPIFATMEFKSGYSEKYIFDAYTHLTDTLLIYPSLASNAWKLSVVDKDGFPMNEFLYFKTKDGYSLELESDKTSEVTEVELLMMDYAKYRNYRELGVGPGQAFLDYLDNDYREAVIVLETLEDDGTASKRMERRIRQYNAITVEVKEKNKGDVEAYRGFARYDYGTKRDFDGNVMELTGDDILDVTYPKYKDEKNLPARYNNGLGLAMGWGYWSYNSTFTYKGFASDFDGQHNRNAIIEMITEDKFFQSTRQAYWNACAVNETSRQRFKLNNDNVPEAAESYWYMPACYEMESFLHLALLHGTDGLRVKVAPKDIRYKSDDVCLGYWTSGARTAIVGEVYTYYILNNKVEYNDVMGTLRLYTRQACHLNDAPEL